MTGRITTALTIGTIAGLGAWAAQAQAETIVDLSGSIHTGLYTDWGTAAPGPGASIKLPTFPTGTNYTWDYKAQRNATSAADGTGGNVYSTGNLTVPSGNIPMKLLFNGGDGSTAVTSYLGGTAAGADSNDTLSVHSLKFETANFVGLSKLYLQADIESNRQNHSNYSGQFAIQYGTVAGDFRELDLNGHDLTLSGGVFTGRRHGGYASGTGLNFGGGTLTFQDSLTTTSLVRTAGWSADTAFHQADNAVVPAPTGAATSKASSHYMTGAGTLNWYTTGQQAVSTAWSHFNGAYFTKWDTSQLDVNIGNNKDNAGVSWWEVWADDTKANQALATVTIGGTYAANIKLADNLQNGLAVWTTGMEKLVADTLNIEANGFLDLDGLDVITNYLTVNGSPIGTGVYTAADFANVSDTATGGTITVLIPEPATMSLLALGGIATLARRRRP